MKKRIALAAVAALAGGLIVAAPASATTTAAATPFYVSVADSGANPTAAAAAMTATQVAGASNYVALTAGSNLAAGKAVVTVAGSTIISAGAATAGDTATLNATATQATYVDTDTVGAVIKVATPAAGTITVTVAAAVENTSTGQFTTTTLQTITITVTAAAVTGVVAAATSTAAMDKVGAAVLATDSLTVTAAQGTVSVATIVVALKDANSADVATADSTITIAGAGLISTDGGTTKGRSLAVTDDAGYTVTVFGDNTAGVGTVTITSGAFTASRKVTFYGAVASLSAVVNKKNIKDTGATADVFTVTAKDAAGVAVPGLTLTATSGNTLVAANGVVSTNNDGTYDVEVTPVTDAKGAVTYTFADSVLTTVTTTASVTVSDANAATLTIVADKAEYAPGEKMTFTLTAKDANGAGLPDGTYAAGTILAAANPAISTSLTSYPFGNADLALVAGVGTATAFAPVVAGPVSVTWTLAGTAGTANANLASTLTGTTITVAAKVVAPVDATVTAINAKVASTEATVAALQVTVASVIKSLKVQWWLLKKIAVKVGIKLG